MENKISKTIKYSAFVLTTIIFCLFFIGKVHSQSTDTNFQDNSICSQSSVNYCDAYGAGAPRNCDSNGELGGLTIENFPGCFTFTKGSVRYYCLGANLGTRVITLNPNENLSTKLRSSLGDFGASEESNTCNGYYTGVYNSNTGIDITSLVNQVVTQPSGCSTESMSIVGVITGGLGTNSIMNVNLSGCTKSTSSNLVLRIEDDNGAFSFSKTINVSKDSQGKIDGSYQVTIDVQSIRLAISPTSTAYFEGTLLSGGSSLSNAQFSVDVGSSQEEVNCGDSNQNCCQNTPKCKSGLVCDTSQKCVKSLPNTGGGGGTGDTGETTQGVQSCNNETDELNKNACTKCVSEGGVYTALGCLKTTPAGIIEGLIRIALGVMGGVALVQLILVGLMYQSGKEDKIAEARSKFIATIVGIGVLVFSVLILNIIGVNVLDVLPVGSFVGGG